LPCFPKIHRLSWYIYLIGGQFSFPILYSFIVPGGLDKYRFWTFLHAPPAAVYSKFRRHPSGHPASSINGFLSSILTGPELSSSNRHT